MKKRIANKSSIQVFSRIHISLLDMSMAGYRGNGGLGFFVMEPNLVVTIEKSDAIQTIDSRDVADKAGFSIQILEAWLEKYILELGITHGFQVTIEGDAPSHYGFGVSTAIRMACVEGISMMLDLNLSREDMIKVSCRGGTSGIGVHGYFTGGLVFDLGHTKEDSALLPSRSKENASHNPMLLKTLPMPDWDIGLLIPKNIIPKTSEEEVRFFQETCPIPLSKVYEITYHALFGVLASVESQDKQSFCHAINTIQEQTWKKAERSLYPELSVFEKRLFEYGASAVGMSSLGPTLYFFADDVAAIVKRMEEQNICNPCDILKTSFRNDKRALLNE